MESKERETTPKHRRGDVKRPPQNVTQGVEAIQNLIELTDTGLEEAPSEDWSTFMNALKIVKVDRMRDPLQGKARVANKQSLEIQGVSKGIYKRIPNVSKTFFVKPLIVKNLSCKLNFGAQFNYQTGFIPQKVISYSTSKKTNFSELDGIRIRLQFQDVTNRTLQSMVGDSEFV